MTTARRPYDSPVRRRQAAETRDRIVAAGAELVHELPSWDWSLLTFRAVAERAGVGERTVYRHFPTERLLHDAVMQRLEEEAGVSYEGIGVGDLAPLAARIFASLGSYAASWGGVATDGSTLAAEDDRRRRALRAAVADAAPTWSDDEREAAAAALDAIWALPSYERLVAAWQLEPERATAVIGWLLGLVVDALDRGERPRL